MQLKNMVPISQLISSKKEMRYIIRFLVFILTLVFAIIVASCTGSKLDDKNNSSERMEALAGIPPEAETNSNNIIPNVAPMISASVLVGANLEASTIRTAARVYFTDHPVDLSITSDNLFPLYINNPSKAKYHLSSKNMIITRVDSVSGGWSNIVFSLSQQKWVEGLPDTDHENDQDSP
jgi:hypothetical protein